jgi:sulfate transport system ATP-binding protein
LEVADRVVVLNNGNIEQVGTPDEIYDKPATPFVYQFIDNVNLFHSRVHGGYAKLGELEVEVDGHEATNDAAALAYVRPHDIDISREAGKGAAFSAIVQHIHAIGPVIRLDLAREDATELIEAELTRERFRELQLQEGEHVFVHPRNLRVFLDEKRPVL